jgi:hypothetical protein
MDRLLVALVPLALAAAFGAMPASPALATHEAPRVVLPLRFHVANVRGHAVVDEAWLNTQVNEANRVFAPTGVSFEELGRGPMDGQHARLVSRRDRHALARFLERGVVNIFVVASMVDVDDGSTMRRGVHWTLPWRRDNHFVVLTSIGPRTTLAHELGHYFGNRQHTDVFGNIMSYDHGPAPSLSPAQQRRVQVAARRELRAHSVLSVGRWRALAARGRMPRLFYPGRSSPASFTRRPR